MQMWRLYSCPFRPWTLLLVTIAAVPLAGQAEGQFSCNWAIVDGQQCGHSCGADAYIGHEERYYDCKVSRVDPCLKKCAQTESCRGVDYAAVGLPGSGGPDRVDVQTGCCYYRVKTDCGRSCVSGRTCHTLLGTKSGPYCDFTNALRCNVVAANSRSGPRPSVLSWLLVAAHVAVACCQAGAQPRWRRQALGICQWYNSAAASH
mmetsp:Transcript_34468/g.94886  ORF Transcript_34468/g.94886 Transcript_34468/m.94886 type:complete len:204 (-) Transcript_34468:162-773(-)